MGSISIILENHQPERFTASVLGLPDCQAEGSTRAEALDNVQKALAVRLQAAEIVSSEIPSPHPLLELAGVFKDDPQWDEFQAAIAAYRQEENAKLEAEYQRLDEAEPGLNSGNSAA